MSFAKTLSDHLFNSFVIPLFAHIDKVLANFGDLNHLPRLWQQLFAQALPAKKIPSDYIFKYLQTDGRDFADIQKKLYSKPYISVWRENRLYS